jgi:hypothetical protein
MSRLRINRTIGGIEIQSANFSIPALPELIRSRRRCRHLDSEPVQVTESVQFGQSSSAIGHPTTSTSAAGSSLTL